VKDFLILYSNRILVSAPFFLPQGPLKEARPNGSENPPVTSFRKPTPHKYYCSVTGRSAPLYTFTVLGDYYLCIKLSESFPFLIYLFCPHFPKETSHTLSFYSTRFHVVSPVPLINPFPFSVASFFQVTVFCVPIFHGLLLRYYFLYIMSLYKVSKVLFILIRIFSLQLRHHPTSSVFSPSLFPCNMPALAFYLSFRA